MRKTFTLLIALMALCAGMWAQSQIGPIDGFYYEIDGSGNATLIKLPGSGDWASYEISGDITIPGTVNDGVSDYTVTAIGQKAFVNVGITSVTIEEGVTDIYNDAFFGSSLQTATLPSTITYIGNQSFDYTPLTAFVITATSPASFGYDGDPFSHVSTLEHIYVPAASVDAYKTAWSSYASLIVEKPVWVTWNQTNVESVNLVAISEGETSSQTVKDITVTASSPASGDYATFSTSEYGNSISIRYGGTLTFAPTSGKLKGISISCGGHEEHEHLAAGSGWTWNGSKYTLEWSGDAATSVVLACDGSSDGIYFGQNTSIVFTLEAEEEPAPATTTTITWESTDVAPISLSCPNVDDVATTSNIKGITASLKRTSEYGSKCQFTDSEPWINGCGELKFTSSVGDISGILITCDPYQDVWGYSDLSAGWTFDGEAKIFTWTGTPSSSVTLSGYIDFLVASIEFTVTSGSASSDPANQEPVTWDFANDAELASIYLSRYTNYDFNGYYSEGKTVDYVDTVKVFKDIVATISAFTSGAYASFSDNNNYSISLESGGTLSFSTELGQFQSIVVNTNNGSGRSSGDWAWSIEGKTLTWSGTPTDSVVLDDVYVDEITSIVFTFVSSAPVPALTPNITWDATEVATISLYGSSLNTLESGTEIDGITPSIMKTSYSGSYCYFASSRIRIDDNGELIFTSSVGDIQGIVLAFDNSESYTISDFPVGWTLDEGEGTLTWIGTAAEEVSLAGNISCTVTSIGFSVIEEPAPVYPTPSGPSFIWQSRQVSHVLLSIDNNGDSQTTHVIKNIITSLQRTAAKADEYDFCLFANNGINIKNNGTLTFRSIVGDLTGIVITCGYKYYADDLSEGWRYDSENGTLIWVGTPAETVTLSGHVDVSNISSIEFFYTPAPAPRKGETFFGIYNQNYQITGAHTAKLPAQDLDHTLQIPEYVDYEDVRYYVTEIADYAFYGQAELPNVFGGANIAKIGAHAFDGCIQIADISLYSDVLDTIGNAACNDCKLMANFDCMTQLPPVLGSNAFSGTTYLNRIRVNSASDYKAATNWSEYSDKIVTLWENPAIGEQFFWSNQMTTNWYAVSSVSPVKEAKVLPYPAGVKAIYPRTLVGRLVVPEEISYLYQEYKVTGIGANAYKDSTGFYMVMIPQSVKSIESGAFLNCTGVESVQFLWDDPTEVTWADATVGAEFKTAASGETKIGVPKGTLAAYQAWAPAWASCMVEGEILDIDVTASEDPNHVGRYYRTFYDSETDYLMPPSVWAHAGYVSGGNFVLRPVAFDGMVLPRGTAVVLESETPTYRLVPVGNTAPLYDGENDLVGTDVAIPRTSVGDNGENVYVLGKRASVGGNLQVGMGLYKYTGTTLGAHKAYLIYNAPSGPNNAPARFLFRHENTPTDVENVQDSNTSCSKILRDGQLIIIKDNKEYNAQGLIIK